MWYLTLLLKKSYSDFKSLGLILVLKVSGYKINIVSYTQSFVKAYRQINPIQFSCENALSKISKRTHQNSVLRICKALMQPLIPIHYDCSKAPDRLSIQLKHLYPQEGSNQMHTISMLNIIDLFL